MRKFFIFSILFLSFQSLLFATKDPINCTKKINGYLVDYKTKDEVDEVQVKLKSYVNGKTYITETNDEGVFTFENVPIGKSIILLTDKDYRPDTLKIFETNAKEHLIHYTFSKEQPFTANLKVSWMFNWGDRTITKNGKTYVQEHYWAHMAARIILIIYGLCLLLIFYYSCVQMSLAIAYVRNRKKIKEESVPQFNEVNAQKVTVQLPMFNEMYVAERIIETVAEFDYPRDKFQIQVLDDSTDETKDIIAAKVAEVAARGINIQHIHRVDRTGYKAGALDAAMDRV
ncbi:MAG: hypothetical protein ACOVNZ_07530, partial [Crocinitomicaceae bacterium]